MEEEEGEEGSVPAEGGGEYLRGGGEEIEVRGEEAAPAPSGRPGGDYISVWINKILVTSK